MRAVLFVAAMTVMGGSVWADSPRVYLFDVLRRPSYRAAYEHMLSGQANLPDWMSSAAKAEAATMSAGESAVIGGHEIEVFHACKSHACDRSSLTVMFTSYGDRAKGALVNDGKVRLLGKPDPDESRKLLESAN